MVDFDHTFNMLKMHIKKEIVDNYFAERAYLEEDLEVLAKKEEEYESEFNRALPIFAAFYQLVPTNAAMSAILQLWGVTERPLSPEVNQVSPAEKQAVLDNYRAAWVDGQRTVKEIRFSIFTMICKKPPRPSERNSSRWRLIANCIMKMWKNLIKILILISSLPR